MIMIVIGIFWLNEPTHIQLLTLNQTTNWQSMIRQYLKRNHLLVDFIKGFEVLSWFIR